MSAQSTAPRSTLIGQTISGQRIWLTDRNPHTPQAWYTGTHCYVVGARIEIDRKRVASYLRATARYASTRSASLWSVRGT
jgi:hypothetical protein